MCQKKIRDESHRKDLLLAKHLVYLHSMYVCPCVKFAYVLRMRRSMRTHMKEDVHEGFAPCKGEQDVHRTTL